MSEEMVAVCNRCGSKGCLDKNGDVCEYDGYKGREVANVPMVKWLRNDEAHVDSGEKKVVRIPRRVQ